MEAQPVSEKRALLKSVFGYEGFRPGQEQLIDALLQGRDAMIRSPDRSRANRLRLLQS